MRHSSHPVMHGIRWSVWGATIDLGLSRFAIIHRKSFIHSQSVSEADTVTTTLMKKIKHLKVPAISVLNTLPFLTAPHFAVLLQ